MMVVATYIEEFEGKVSSASVKQPMAALRMLFDWLVVGPALQSGELGAGTDALPPGQRLRMRLCRRFVLIGVGYDGRGETDGLSREIGKRPTANLEWLARRNFGVAR